MTDNTTPEHLQQGMQHVSIPLAQAMEELLQRADAVLDQEETQEQ